MIGNKASGKTTFMGCAYDIAHSGMGDFYLNADEDTHSRLSSIAKAVKCGRYPLPTDSRQSWDFEICLKKSRYSDSDRANRKQIIYGVNLEKIEPMTWVDWNGGVISEERINSDLYDDIESAHTVLVFLESSLIWDLDSDEGDEKTCYTAIVDVISEIVSERDRNKEPLNIVFILTKADLADECHDDSLIDNIIDFSNGISENNEWLSSKIIPTICTKNRIVNSKYAMLYIVHEYLRLQYSLAKIKYKQYDSNASVWESIVSFFHGVKSNRKMADTEYDKYNRIQPSMDKLKILLDYCYFDDADLNIYK
jgi:hypothetical protein